MGEKYVTLILGFAIGGVGTYLVMSRLHKKQLLAVSHYVHEKTWNDAHESVDKLLVWGAENGKHPAELHRMLTS